MIGENSQKVIITPENVRLIFTIADPPVRLAALVIDILIIFIICGTVWLLLGLIFSGTVLWGFYFMLSFFLRVGYFVYYENTDRHATIGKRKTGLRVIHQGGLPLTIQSILIRNLAREIEISMPMQFFIFVFKDSNMTALAFFTLWVIAIGLAAYTNKYKMRIGDLLAGTLVVTLENVVIKEDNYQEKRESVFSEVQLGYYGIYELQTLAALLEMQPSPERDEKIVKVAEVIKNRIRWTNNSIDAVTFLQQFYTAQRDHLEQKLLFGKRKENKHAG